MRCRLIAGRGGAQTALPRSASTSQAQKPDGKSSRLELGFDYALWYFIEIAYLTQGVKVMFVAAGSGACHSIIGDAEGTCYTCGRNEVRLVTLSGGPCSSAVSCYNPAHNTIAELIHAQH